MTDNRPRKTWLANTSGTAIVDGQVVAFVAGETRVMDNSPLLDIYPTYFDQVTPADAEHIGPLAATGQLTGAFVPAAAALRGGIHTSTPGAVGSITIAHGVGSTPTKFGVTPGNAAARTAALPYITADATNLTVNFAGTLAPATEYKFNWFAAA